MAEVERVTAGEVKRRMDSGDQLVFIDARNQHDWSRSDFKLPGALRIPVSEMEERMEEVPRDQTIITYCT